MANLKVNYTCGCGFHTTEPLKALDHCNEKKHTITVNGTIEPGEPKPVKASRQPANNLQEQSTADTASYERLRQMVMGNRR